MPPTLASAEGPDIDIELENVLLEHFKQHRNIVNKIQYRDTKKNFLSIILNMLSPLKSSQYMGPLRKSLKKIS